ncbi:MAG: PD-(D/E)XK nuclease family protein [Epsilonproteobacteria bacterium]|nr:PD-(D/E)XK nuclease family protein [Campylobacterota bacterium]
MKIVHIYATSRAIRSQQQQFRTQEGLLPTLMRIDEFERRAILLPNLAMVDTLQRRLLLEEAANFHSFEGLKINRDLVRFFTKSDAIFKFFEELSHESVSFNDLVEGDAYVEFAEHIEILEELLANYRQLLLEKGLTDRVFIPEIYRLNRGFVESYDKFELHLEGYMSYYELSLIEQIAKIKPFVIHMQTSKFNKKVQERFLQMGIALPSDSMLSFDLQSKEILYSSPVSSKIKAEVFSVEERLAQVPLVLSSVQKMVEEGIAPEDIVLILPDESFKETLRLYDRLNNFNFAMGFDYSKTKSYKCLEAIYEYWHSFSDESIFLLKKYDIDREKLQRVNPTQILKVEAFFELMTPFDLDLQRSIIEEGQVYFKRVFSDEVMSLSAWLFLWLKYLSTLSLDDVRGGKVTVMGALETRGVHFEGVVIVDFNDGIVPAIPAKDGFLNSSLRKFANLPTKNDREALQKQIYKRLLEQAKEATIIYSLSDNKAPAGYLYELGLKEGEAKEVDMTLLYDSSNPLLEQKDPIIENFDAGKITWSATRLKSFLMCKRKYYYTYEIKLNIKEQNEIIEGVILHNALEYLFKNRHYFESVEAMKSAIDRVLDSILETTSSKIAYNKLLWKSKLVKFIEKQVYHFKAGWRVVEREKQIVGEIGGIQFKGVVDRIDQTDTHTMILDYKSGSIAEANRTKNLEKLTDFQMSIYAELLKGKYQNIDLAFIELFNGGNITPITELEVKTELLYEAIDEMKSMNSVVCERCESVSLCQYCDFTLLCERGDYL